MTHRPNAHPGSQAVTLREAGADTAPKATIEVVQRYPRPGGGEYRVVRDSTAHQGVGIYRVYVDQVEVGRQSSYPSLDDCARLEQNCKPQATPRTATRGGYYRKYRPAPGKSKRAA